MPWVFGGAWDGRRAQDLPAIMCSVIEQINKRFEVLGLDAWVDAADLNYPQWYDKNGDLLDPLTYPVAADYYGLPISSTVFQDNYALAEDIVRDLVDTHIYADPDFDDVWTLDNGPKERRWAYVKEDTEDTDDTSLDGSAVPWEDGDLPDLRGVAQINQQNQLSVTATGGYFTLTQGGNTTQLINHNAGANIVQDQLERLESIGYGNVTVSQTGASYLIVFTGALAGLDVDDPTVDPSLLTGGTATITRTREPWVGLIRPAGNSIDTWLTLKEYLDKLTIVRFGYTGESFNTITALGWHVSNTVAPFPTFSQALSFAESLQDALWEGSAIPTPPWFDGSVDEVSESQAGLTNSEIVSDFPTLSYYYTLAYRSKISASTPDPTNCGAKIGAVVQIASGDPLATAEGATLRTILRYITTGATAYDFDVSINGIDQGLLTNDAAAQVIEYDDPESVEGIPETFTVSNTETPEASPLDGSTRKLAAFWFAAYRDMSAEF